MSWEKVQGHHPLVEGQERHCKAIALCKRPSKYNPWLFITFSDRKGLHKITIIYKPPPVIFLKTLQLWAHPLQGYDSCQLKWFSLTYHFIDYSKCLYIYKWKMKQVKNNKSLYQRKKNRCILPNMWMFTSFPGTWILLGFILMWKAQDTS